jgi:hypothetical protein
MSITGGLNRTADPASSPHPERSSWQQLAAGTARMILGAGSVLIGLVLLFRDLPANRPLDPAFLLLTAVLVLGGAVLVALPAATGGPHGPPGVPRAVRCRVRRPRQACGA